MSLKSLKFAAKKIPLSDDSAFEVRGLSLEDVTILVLRNRELIERVYAEFKGKQGDELQFDEIATALVVDAPSLVADIIALASGELDDETADIASKLPFTVQLLALEAIGELTFTTEASLKKVVETVTRVMESSTKAINSLQQ